MKTSELIDLLAADRTLQRPPGHGLALALLPGMAIALVIFVYLAGWRENLIESLTDPRFLLKLLLNACAALSAGLLLLRWSRPVGIAGIWRAILVLLGLLLLIAVIAELLVLPRDQWWQAARGSNATWCLRLIPALAAGPLVAALWMLRSAAPARPALAGFAAGLMSAGIGGLLYATHCPDDSPLFVALWYGLATLMVAAAGALAGARLLRW